MRAATHLAFAGLTGVVGAGFGAGPDIPGGVTLALGSLLPDIDTPHSMIGKLTPALSRSLEKHFGHRTITHSLIGLLGISLLFSPLLLIHRPLWSWLLIGYASHLLLDTANVSGVPLLWPARLQIWLVHNRAWRVPYGSGRESVWLGGIALTALALAPISVTGFTPWFHRALGTPYGAVADYLRWKNENEVWAHVRETNLTTGQHIDGSYRVVGALNSEMLLVEDEQGSAFSAGLGQGASITTERIEVLPGLPISVTSHTIDLSGRTLGSLQLAGVGARVYLTGNLLLESTPTLPPVTGRYPRAQVFGSTLELRAATPADLAALAPARVTGGTVQVRVEAAPDSFVEMPRFADEPSPEVVTMTIIGLSSLEALEVTEGTDLEVGSVLARYPEGDGLRGAIAELEESIARQESERVRHERDNAVLALEEERLAGSVDVFNDGLGRLRYLVTAGVEPRVRLERFEVEMSALLREREDLAMEREHLEFGRAEQRAAGLADIQRLRDEVARERERLAVRSPLAGTLSRVRLVRARGDVLDVELEILVWE